MTRREKDAIRDSFCCLCLVVPPFADGSRCHPHRIIRGQDGGQYVDGNVIALCPECHKATDRVACITAARSGAYRLHELHPMMARENGLKNIKTLLALSPEQRAANARKAGLASAARLSPEERRARSRVALQSSDPVAAGRKGAAALGNRRLRDGLTPAELAHVRRIGRRDWGKGPRAMNAGLTAERRSEIARAARQSQLLASGGL